MSEEDNVCIDKTICEDDIKLLNTGGKKSVGNMGKNRKITTTINLRNSYERSIPTKLELGIQITSDRLSELESMIENRLAFENYEDIARILRDNGGKRRQIVLFAAKAFDKTFGMEGRIGCLGSELIGTLLGSQKGYGSAIIAREFDIKFTEVLVVKFMNKLCHIWS